MEEEFNLPSAIEKCENSFVNIDDDVNENENRQIAQYLKEYALFKIKNLISREFLQLNDFQKNPVGGFIFYDAGVEIEAMAEIDLCDIWHITARFISFEEGRGINECFITTIGQFNMFLSAVGMAERVKQFNKYPAVIFFDEGNGKTSSKLN